MIEILKAVLATIIALAIIIVIYVTAENIIKLQHEENRGKVQCIEIWDSAVGAVTDIECYNVETGETVN